MTSNERKQVVIAGGGIGGLAAALACAQRAVPVQLLERAAQLSEVGAGIQIGPNVTGILQAWGLGTACGIIIFFSVMNVTFNLGRIVESNVPPAPRIT